MLADPTVALRRRLTERRTTPVAACGLLLTALVATGGCLRGHPDDDGRRITRHIAMHDTGAVARTRWGKPALIGPDGSLSIDGVAVPLDPAQRRAAKRYHDLTAALYADALALAGTPDSAAAKLDAAAGDGIPATPAVDATASPPYADHGWATGELCARIGELEAAQRALVDAAPAFKPHATLPDGIGAQCASALIR